MARVITVFLRFDDYSATSSFDVERPLVEALGAARCCATFAVIPEVTEGRYHDAGERAVMPLGGEKATYLRDAIDRGAVDLALHGWNHRTRALRPPHGEFVGLSVAEQRERLSRGRSLFRETLGLDTGVFVPPWNAYDEATLMALEQEGMTCISANRFGPVRDGRVVYVPITTDIAGLEQAVERARSTTAPDPIIGVLFHHYDFTESGDPRATVSCAQFGERLAWLKGQPDVEVRSIRQISEQHQALDHRRYQANQPMPFESLAPPFVRKTEDDVIFHAEREGRRIKFARMAATWGVYGATVIAGILAGARVPVIRPPYVEYALTAFVALLLARSLVKQQLHFKACFTIILLTGVLVGLLL